MRGKIPRHFVALPIVIAVFVAGTIVVWAKPNQWIECKYMCNDDQEKCLRSGAVTSPACIAYAACYWACKLFMHTPATKSIGSLGGTLILENDLYEWGKIIEVDIPPGALTENVTFTLRAIIQPYPTSVPPPYGMVIMAFELSPPTTFNENVTCKLIYGDFDMACGVFSPDNLAGARLRTDNTWEIIPSTVDYENKVVTFKSNLHTFGVLAKSGLRPVGGIAFPVNKPAPLAPWIALAALIAIATVSVAVYWRRLKV